MSEDTKKAEEPEAEKTDAKPEAASAAEEKAEQTETSAEADKAESGEKAAEEKSEEKPAEEKPEAKEESAAAEEKDPSDESEAKAEEKPQAKEDPEAAEAKEQADKSGDKAEPEATKEEKSAGADKAGGGEEKSDALKKAERILREQEGPGAGREAEEDLFEKVVHINRCAKVVKGGRRFSFSALVVSGDKEGQVGLGFGKAQEVAECIRKASDASKKQMVKVKITENTIPHPVVGEHGGGRVLLRPASPGTGLIAGGGVRAVVEAAGIKDVLAKSLGSNNHANVVKATLNALDQLRTKEEIYALRGKRVAEKKAL